MPNVQTCADLEVYVPDVLGSDGGQLHCAALPHRGQRRVPGQVTDVTEKWENIRNKTKY